MVFGIPIAKLLPEVFKAVTKPMVNILKRNVRKSPFWKDKMFIPMAQRYNRISVRVRLWTQGITRNKEQVEKSAKMSDEAALELGAEIVANVTTFVIGLAAIVMQQTIAAATEKKKEEEEDEESAKIETALQDLTEKVEKMDITVLTIQERLTEINETVELIKSQDSRSKLTSHKQ